MKLSRDRLQTIIREEISRVLNEQVKLVDGKFVDDFLPPDQLDPRVNKQLYMDLLARLRVPDDELLEKGPNFLILYPHPVGHPDANGDESPEKIEWRRALAADAIRAVYRGFLHAAQEEDEIDRLIWLSEQGGDKYDVINYIDPWAWQKPGQDFDEAGLGDTEPGETTRDFVWKLFGANPDPSQWEHLQDRR